MPQSLKTAQWSPREQTEHKFLSNAFSIIEILHLFVLFLLVGILWT